MNYNTNSNKNIIKHNKDIHNKDYPLLLNKWMSTISHVPQNIFLTDGTIAENIAFGSPKEEIDQLVNPELSSISDAFDNYKDKVNKFQLLSVIQNRCSASPTVVAVSAPVSST